MMKKYQKTLNFLSLCLLNAGTGMIASIQAPIYPKEASEKNFPATEFGFVFGVFQISFFLSSLLSGKLSSLVGVWFVNSTGILLCGSSCLLFGFVHFMYNIEFIIFSFLLRVIEGVGAGMFSATSLAIISNNFEENIRIANSVSQSFYGVGIILGPGIGGFLYQVGGFTLPFEIVGSIMLILWSFVLLLPRESKSSPLEKKSKLGVFDLLRYFSIICYFTGIFYSNFGIAYLDVTLQPALQTIQLNTSTVGLIFLLSAIGYTASCPIWGRICNNCCHPTVALIAASTLSAVAFLFTGPAPFMPFSLSISSSYPSLLLLGISFGGYSIASQSGFYLESVELGFPETPEVRTLFFGLWCSGAALGAFSGASLGGILLDNVGFAWASVTMGAVSFALLILYFVFMFKKFKTKAFLSI